MPTSAVPPGALAKLADLVEARGGLRFLDGRRFELDAKASRAFVESGSPSWDHYFALLRGPDGAPEMERLLEMLVVGETYFFRHQPYFNMLEREVLPALIARLPSAHQINIWCAGCATGEEAYSLAVLVRRLLPEVDQRRVSILATDLSRHFLRGAEDGVYGEWSFRETDAAFKTENFTSEGNRYRVRPELRRLTRFRQLNLIEEGYPSVADGTADFELILCRNVLIYFGPEVAERIIARLRAALVPDGYLVLGPSDSLPGPVKGFELRSGLNAFLYQRTDAEAGAPSPEASVARTVLAESRTDPHGTPRRIPAAAASHADGLDEPLVVDADWLTIWRAARDSADRGQIGEAATRCREAIVSARHRPEPYYLLGTLHQLQGDETGAINALRQALYVDRGFVPAHLALAAVHRQAGRPEEARRVLARGQRALDGRVAEELVLADEGLTVGRLRDTLARALADVPRIEAA
jgi:chemotaxis protein methyltransferase CheR